VTVVPVGDPAEARGVNTPDDLDFARQAYQRCPD
jgi:bifunctional UDP-N-acetylglucosamine pyrophosphorylase/glucosamine-1-phosphate N-acetyltransferase